MSIAVFQESCPSPRRWLLAGTQSFAARLPLSKLVLQVYRLPPSLLSIRLASAAGARLALATRSWDWAVRGLEGLEECGVHGRPMAPRGLGAPAVQLARSDRGRQKVAPPSRLPKKPDMSPTECAILKQL